MTVLVALLFGLLSDRQKAAVIFCPPMWVIPIGAVYVDGMLILGC